SAESLAGVGARRRALRSARDRAAARQVGCAGAFSGIEPDAARAGARCGRRRPHMKRPRALDAMIMRFDRLSLRERLLIFGALLAGVITAWQGTLMEPLAQREKTLSVELTGLQESLARVSRATESVASSDPTTQALQRLADRKKALEAINAKLAAESAGLI